MSDWQVIKTPIWTPDGGVEYLYQVVRIKDESKPMHAGNIEVAGCSENEEEMCNLAATLNGTYRNAAVARNVADYLNRKG